MKINFHLEWQESRHAGPKAFKLAGTRALFSEYLERIQSFGACESAGKIQEKDFKENATQLWVCDRGEGAALFSSEKLAEKLQVMQNSGVKRWIITIGRPDGFKKNDLALLKPAVKWSFGPMTYPHELAAVIAAEQVYRAWSILRKLPYHTGH